MTLTKERMEIIRQDLQNARAHNDHGGRFDHRNGMTLLDAAQDLYNAHSKLVTCIEETMRQAGVYLDEVKRRD